MYTLKVIYQTGVIKNYYLGEEFTVLNKKSPRLVSQEKNDIEFEREIKLYKQANESTVFYDGWDNDITSFVMSEGENKTYPISLEKQAYIIGEKGNTITKIN